MSKEEKLIQRILSLPKDFTIDELTTLLKRLGYSASNKGATSGSRMAFIHEQTKHVISIHKPHPKKELGIGTLKDVVASLREQSLL